MVDQPQEQTVIGADAIGVQVLGDGAFVQIAIGGAALVLQRIHRLKAEPTQILELLRADVRATTLVGREAELDALAQWRESSEAISLRCFIGQAGAGKTRLAVEACEQAEAAGWTAGFVSGEELRRFHKTQSLANWRAEKESLIVVDYAASSLAVLRTWLDLLAPHRNAAGGTRLRILLLERHANPGSGWWADLGRRASRSHADAADLVGEEPPILLLPPSDLEDRRTLLAEAMMLAAPLLDSPVAHVPQPPGAGENAWFDERLASSQIENGPLYLLMAGAHAVHTDAPTALTLGASELSTIMAGFEHDRITRFARARGFKDDDGAIISHLAACVTLQNGCPREAVADLVAEEIRGLSWTGAGGAAAASKALFDCLAETGGKLDAIRPDLVGEAFSILTIANEPHHAADTALNTVLRGHQRDPMGVVATLIRGTCDHADRRTGQLAIRWLESITDASNDHYALIDIAVRLPEQTLVLREFAAKVTERVVARLRVGENGAESPAVLAGWLSDLAIRLSELGRPDAALDAGQEAVNILRALERQQPGAFTPDLAMTLNNLSNRLSEMGKRKAAFETAQESVFLRRALAAERPDLFTSNLAKSLVNLANRLSDLDRPEPALEAAEEAVKHFRALALTQPDKLNPSLAASLNNLAHFRGNLGLAESALEAAQEALFLRRALAAEQPDAFTPSLAKSLNTLAIFLCVLNKNEPAFQSAQESIVLFRALSTERPDAFTPSFAGALATLGFVLEDREQFEDAAERFGEAIAALGPYFLVRQSLHVRTMLKLVRGYYRSCEAAGMEPDDYLLAPFSGLLPDTQSNFQDNLEVEE